MASNKYDKVYVGATHLAKYRGEFLKQQQGDFLMVGPDREESRFAETLSWLKRHGIAFHLIGQQLPSHLQGKGYDKMKGRMGELCHGRYIFTELGWTVYVPRDYLEDLPAEQSKAKIMYGASGQAMFSHLFRGAKDMADAKARWIKSASHFFDEARAQTPTAVIH